MAALQFFCHAMLFLQFSGFLIDIPEPHTDKTHSAGNGRDDEAGTFRRLMHSGPVRSENRRSRRCPAPA